MRLTSLDVFRGITIAAMILVNMASIAEPDVYPPLLHAAWNGCTPTDLVFPFFLFIIGVAMSFSLAKYTDNQDGKQPKPSPYLDIRCLRDVSSKMVYQSVIILSDRINKTEF